MRIAVEAPGGLHCIWRSIYRSHLLKWWSFTVENTALVCFVCGVDLTCLMANKKVIFWCFVTQVFDASLVFVGF